MQRLRWTARRKYWRYAELFHTVWHRTNTVAINIPAAAHR